MNFRNFVFGWGISACAILLFAMAPAASADSVTYTYTGKSFQSFDLGYVCHQGCNISGSVTLAQALPANLNSMAAFSPLAYSFTDGTTTITQINSAVGSVFDFFQTNGSGQIIGWDIFLLSGNKVLTTTTLGTPLDLTTDFTSGADAFILGNPGNWTSSAQNVPEPGSLMLLGSGLVGLLGCFARSRRTGEAAVDQA